MLFHIYFTIHVCTLSALLLPYIQSAIARHQGPTNVQDVWEEGYALNELKRRSVELLEKKEEFEKRRKKLSNLRKKKKGGPAVPGSSSSNLSMAAPEGIDDDDLDLIAESEAIRTHLEQLKK
jgi:hypothetical protein